MISCGLFVSISACNSGKTEGQNRNADETKKTVADSNMQIPPSKPYEGIIFASKRDTICGMPLSAGVEDTLHVNGKIYGFCAKECKEEFIKQLTAKKSK